MLGDLGVGHAGCGEIQDLGLPLRNLFSQRIVGGIGSVRIEYHVCRFPTKNESAVTAGLDGACHLVDAQLTMDQIAPGAGVECLTDATGVSIRGEHDD